MKDWLTPRDYNSLQKQQSALDDLIFKHHQTSRSLTINQRQLSFLIELAEFANEVRFFKYWSHKPASDRAVLLEEYVDCLHFLISLSLDLKLDFIQDFTIINLQPTNCDVQKLVFKIINQFNRLHHQFNRDHYWSLWISFMQLAIIFKFSRAEIMTAYDYKYQINLQRQANAY